VRAVIQRVKRCTVSVSGRVTSDAGEGLLVLLGVARGDDDRDLEYVAAKTTNLRIFPDEEGRMNLSVLDIAGEVTVVSQFTLLADTRKGRRPSFMNAAEPQYARPACERFVDRLRASGLAVGTGVFGEMMMVSLDNWGPVTVIVDSADLA
jgi:D-tyrosyl-tRNA(Tyr) deacylase